MTTIERFLDDKGIIKVWPAKKEVKMKILEYLSTKFEYDVIYSEKEINTIIDTWHSFNDYFLLRRGMIDYKFLYRTKDGAKYWREKKNS